VYAPVAGEIIETNNKAVNEALNGDSRALTTDPFGTFWLVKLKVAPSASLDHMMDAAAYEKHAASEAGH
jgi:glycine cleavage system H protein